MAGCLVLVPSVPGVDTLAPTLATTCAIRALFHHLCQAMNPAWISERMPLINLYWMIRM